MTTTPWGEALLQSLLNGPRSRENVVTTMGEVIPPGVAYRHWQRRSKYRRENHTNITGRHPRRVEVAMEIAVQSGRKDMATQVISGAIRDERLFSFTAKGVEHISLGKMIVGTGPVYRMAIIRCRQSHHWYDGIGEYEICHRWFEHVREALELFNGSLRERERKRYASVQLPIEE